MHLPNLPSDELALACIVTGRRNFNQRYKGEKNTPTKMPLYTQPLKGLPRQGHACLSLLQSPNKNNNDIRRGRHLHLQVVRSAAYIKLAQRFKRAAPLHQTEMKEEHVHLPILPSERKAAVAQARNNFKWGF